MTGSCRASTAGRAAVPTRSTVSIPGIGAANILGNDGNPGVRVAVRCDPGKGWSGDPYKQIENPECLAPPPSGSDGADSARFFLRNAPINNLDLSIAKKFLVGKGGRIGLEVRLDAFNALNHTQFITVNNGGNMAVSFASLSNPTITNPVYDANGNLVRNNGFGAIAGVAAPRQLQLVTRLTF